MLFRRLGSRLGNEHCAGHVRACFSYFSYKITTVAPSPTHPSPTPTAVNTAPNPQPGVHDACSEATRAELGCNSNVYGSRAVCGEMVDAPVLGGACVGVKRWG